MLPCSPLEIPELGPLSISAGSSPPRESDSERSAAYGPPPSPADSVVSKTISTAPEWAAPMSVRRKIRKQTFSREVSQLADAYMQRADAWEEATLDVLRRWEALCEALHASHAIHQAQILAAEDTTVESVAQRAQERDAAARETERDRQVKRTAEISELRGAVGRAAAWQLAVARGALQGLTQPA